MRAGEKPICVQKGIDRKEEKKAIHKLICGRNASVDEITVEMLRYEGETM